MIPDHRAAGGGEPLGGGGRRGGTAEPGSYMISGLRRRHYVVVACMAPGLGFETQACKVQGFVQKLQNRGFQRSCFSVYRR